MASWAKNQIAKQLAKFAKNLDPNSLSLKFFKGEGELNNLELDEQMLSDLLEFPPWLQLTKVTCNKITAKVPWTSLKSDPIRLHLDRVEVEILASEVARAKATNLPSFANKSNSKPTKYGYAEKVVDGMYVSINTVLVLFTSTGFKASVNVSRIVVQSTTADWKQSNNLRHTRIKDDAKGETLNFKEIKWGTMRVDADAAYKPESKEIPSTPLRLITNNSAVRLVIKKRISDCQMMASKLVVILDDILWVLTRSQILKLSSFIHYLIKLRSKYLPIAHQTASQLHKQDTPQSSPAQKQQATTEPLFLAYDIHETSLHLRTQQIDLHLCDDAIMDGSSSFGDSAQSTNENNKKYGFDDQGAALQISLMNISLDHCPYHVVGRKRSMLSVDDELAYLRKKWATQLLNNFQETEGKRWNQPRSSTSGKNQNHRRRPVMYESFVVAMVQDFQIMQVTTPKSTEPIPFLASEKKSLFLPKEMASIHFDHTTYYYVGNTDALSVPAPNVFVQVNPIQLTFDPLTCVWLNRFALSVVSGLDWTKEFLVTESGFAEHVDVRIEALMPKIKIPLTNDAGLSHLDERPSEMQIQISQAVVSNCRVGGRASQADILNDLQIFLGSRHYADLTCFPNQPEDFVVYSNSTWLNDFSINYQQLQNLTKRDKKLYEKLNRNHNLPHQVWCVWCDQVWIEFTGIKKADSRPVTFVDAFPLRLWICQSVPYNSPPSRTISPESLSGFEMGCVIVKDDNLRTEVATNSSKNPPSDPYLNQKELLPNVDDSNRLRATHSDSDLSLPRHHSVDTISLNEFNLDQKNRGLADPPPPYTSSQTSLGFMNSTGLLPPTYDVAMNDDIGEIEKPPIADVIDYSTGNCREPSMAMLLSVTKTVQIRLDHFQMLSLIRMSEVFQAVSERIVYDNKEEEDRRKVSLKISQDDDLILDADDSVLLNISIPSIVVDLVLHPCYGIDPIQQLSYGDRVRYECEKKEKELQTNEFLGSTYLPLLVKSKSIPSPDISPAIEHCRRPSNDFVSSNELTLQHYELCSAREEENLDFSNIHPLCANAEQGNVTTLQQSPTDLKLTDLLNNVEDYDDTLKEVRDMAVQAGNSLLKVNLKPLPEQQLVSVFRAQLGTVSIGLQSDGDDTVVKVVAETLNLIECGNMKYGKMLDPRGNVVPENEKEGQKISMPALTGEGVFKMRLISGPGAEQFAEGGQELGFADIRIKSLAAGLLASTVDNLTEFAEDEYVLATMPFIVNISRSDISLYDDKPRRYQSAIKLPPTQVLIDNLQVNRDANGVITLNYNPLPETTRTDDYFTEAVENIDMRVHSNSVTSALIAESINQQVDALIGENGRLLEDLKVVNAKVNGLHAERESLLKVIDKLQEELMHSNRENDELHNRVKTLTLSRNRGGNS